MSHMLQTINVNNKKVDDPKYSCRPSRNFASINIRSRAMRESNPLVPNYHYAGLSQAQFLPEESNKNKFT